VPTTIGRSATATIKVMSEPAASADMSNMPEMLVTNLQQILQQIAARPASLPCAPHKQNGRPDFEETQGGHKVSFGMGAPWGNNRDGVDCRDQAARYARQGRGSIQANFCSRTRCE
jgi:hypothetical protein